MANISIPARDPTPSWFDRPLFPARARLGALAAYWEAWAYSALVLAGLVMRLYQLGSRALHHDESLHAYFAWKLFIGQGYAYDPLMHGPLKFEVVPLFYLLLGDTEMAARMFPALVGTALIALPFFLRRYITPVGALATAAMIAISPTLVYFSRFIRDDIYLATFSLIIFICIVSYLDHPRPAVLYTLAAAAALAMASMEAAYLNFFIFGSFLIVEGLRERLTKARGPVMRALTTTSADTWLTALSIFVVITVVLYSTFFTNPYGIWDTKHSFFLPGKAWTLGGLNPDRKDIIGGIFYWKAQHTVQRGNEPTFYYLLLLPLYEQLALLFGLAGLVYAAVRRTLATTFLAWWAVMAFGMYSWAGEKMPWLVMHIALPLMLLAGLALGAALQHARRSIVIGTCVVALVLAALEIHSTFLLNYVDAANPVEMLIYVQTSQDVPTVSHELAALSRKTTGNLSMPIALDTTDVGGWPFTWYLRHFTNVTETTSFTGNACGGRPCSVMLLLGPEYDQNASQLGNQYVVQKYRWNWWFPQDYMTWFPQNMGGPFDGKIAPITGVGSSTDWLHVWQWLIYRRPFADPTGQNARWLYVLVRRNLVPNPGYYTAPGSTAAPTTGPVMRMSSLPATQIKTIGGLLGGTRALNGPRGIAAAANGDIYVADTLNHRVVRYAPDGRELNTIGSAGAGPGQFALRDSPQGVAIGPDGNVYATDTWNQRIEVFTPGGRLLRSWGGGQIGAGNGQFYGPRSLAVASNGDVYVADTGNKRIQVFSPTGRFIRSWGSPGAGPGQFQEPSAVAIGPHNDVYVADFWNQRIQVFNRTGRFIRSWPVSSWVTGSYEEPYISVDSHTGDVYTSDPVHGQVLGFSSTGKSLGAITSGSFTLPVGVAAETGNRIAVGDVTQSHVVLFRLHPSQATNKIGKALKGSTR